MKTTLYFSLVVLSCLAVACNRSSAPTPPNAAAFSPDELARIGEHSIRRSDFEAELERRAHGRSEASGWTEDRIALLNELVTFEALYLRAREAGFDQRPDIARQLKRFIVEQFSAEQLSDDSELPPVSDAELTRAYREQLDRFATPEQVRFAVIQFGYSPKADDERKTAVIDQAGKVLEEAREAISQEEIFGSLARRHSEHQATRYRGGDAGWVSQEAGLAWPPAVIEAAFALERPGALGPVIITENGCYLVRLLDRQPAGHRPLEEVKEVLRYQLAVRQRDQLKADFTASMKAGLNTKINHALLESIPAPAPAALAATPPALPAR